LGGLGEDFFLIKDLVVMFQWFGVSGKTGNWGFGHGLCSFPESAVSQQG
jgi:hypothetical protein